MATTKIDEEFAAIQTCLNALDPLGEERRTFALQMILSRLGTAAPDRLNGLSRRSAGAGAEPPVANVSAMTPREFLRAKKPTTDVERLTVLAYYLTHNRGRPHFKTQDLTALNTEAGGDKFSNAAFTAGNAVKQNRYLTAAGEGNRQITPRGEDVVNALPDREAVAKVLEELPKRRGRGVRPKGTKKRA
jgi:hypothetical protein